MHNRHLYIGKIRELKEAQSQKELDEAFAPFKENEEFWKKEFETEGIDFDRFKKKNGLDIKPIDKKPKAVGPINMKKEDPIPVPKPIIIPMRKEDEEEEKEEEVKAKESKKEEVDVAALTKMIIDKPIVKRKEK